MLGVVLTVPLQELDVRLIGVHVAENAVVKDTLVDIVVDSCARNANVVNMVVHPYFTLIVLLIYTKPF